MPKVEEPALDEFTAEYKDILLGIYDCVDRIVLNAYFVLGHQGGGFRHWWRQLFGSDKDLDETHLMRMAGRFSRRLLAYCKDRGIPVKHSAAGEHKHQTGEEVLARNPQVKGLFLVLVSKAPGQIWKVQRGEQGQVHLYHPKSLSYVNYYFFHINDPDWGHITIRMCGHPPFPAMIILNGHEYAACQLNKAGRHFIKEGNCFTELKDSSDLALVADALRRPDAIGRLSQVCQQWIYSACLCFALSSEERERSGFRYDFSVYQVEFSRNLHFKSGEQMQTLFESLIDRTRASLDINKIKTILGKQRRPHRRSARKKPVCEEIVVETPKYDLTVFKLHFGGVTFKGYTKGERTLRFEATVHNARVLKCGRVLDRFPTIVSSLAGLLQRFLNVLQAVDSPFLADATWEALPTPSQVGACRVGGVDIQKPRMRAAMEAVVALAAKPRGFTASNVSAQVRSQTGQTAQEYGPTRAAYDMKKLRGKNLIVKLGKSRRYTPTADGIRSITAISVLRDKVLKPLLAGVVTDTISTRQTSGSAIDQRYHAIRKEMSMLLAEVRIAA